LGTRAQAKVEAEGLLSDSREKAKRIEETEKKRIEEFLEQFKKRSERDFKKIEQNSQKIQDKITEREKRFQERIQSQETAFEESKREVDSFNSKVDAFELKLNEKREIEHKLWDEYTSKLEKQSEISKQSVIGGLVQKLVDDKNVEMGKFIQSFESQFQANAEQEAKTVLTAVLSRFARPYCPERGIGNVPFDNENQCNKVLGPEQANLRFLEKLIGVDLMYDEAHQAVNIYGFDPVRRELGRATVESLLKEQRVDEKRMTENHNRVKTELFKKIVRDGERIAKELGADSMKPEVKSMMGALRYRYSFTQNQHFHCAEVGFLCGLLAAELEVPIRDARRAGLLHDIGKAMDHSQEGGHAVIGADFIQQNGEAEHIVHAVRAHHFDETPNSDLAYLVIAADALSGARPGARRSTATTYNQKIQDLQTIAQGFKHVVDTHVLSAGREIRVYVEGSAIDDHGALDLSRDIAQKIESDMTYPGQIKVTVVRQTQAIEFAR
jgi:ribonuclease Y